MTATVVVLDAGALIAVERGGRDVALRLSELPPDARIVIPCSVLAQVWRASPRQARLARLRRSTRVETAALDDAASLAVGALLAASGTADVVDAHVVAVAQRLEALAVLTSDPGDLRRLDPALRLAVV